MKQTVIALSLTLFLTACGPDISGIGNRQGKVNAGVNLPELPSDCRDHTKVEVRRGDRLDVTVLRYDRALKEEHLRTDRCAEFYDATKEGLNNGA